jgi:hypothetical protein
MGNPSGWKKYVWLAAKRKRPGSEVPGLSLKESNYFEPKR